jgi:hypothetical protein
MTVKELIEKLQNYPDDKEIFVSYNIPPCYEPDTVEIGFEHTRWFEYDFGIEIQLS